MPFPQFTEIPGFYIIVLFANDNTHQDQLLLIYLREHICESILAKIILIIWYKFQQAIESKAMIIL